MVFFDEKTTGVRGPVGDGDGLLKGGNRIRWVFCCCCCADDDGLRRRLRLRLPRWLLLLWLGRDGGGHRHHLHCCHHLP